jgi:predicted NAD-dependent protein-ADP-ribosyltransferase YbiA (DUF1768 family)
MLTNMDLTAWQDVVTYLRSLGMRESPQIVRLNICLSNNIRFTLEGAGVIQAYCRDNKMEGKPFTAMLKESITDAEPVEFVSYAARAKLKRELPLAADDTRVKEALSRWDQLAKLFRQIQRFEFIAPGGIQVRFDVSVVREGRGRTYQEARVTTAPVKYEAEAELTADRGAMAAPAALGTLMKGLSWLLQGRQRSHVLVSRQGAEAVTATLMGIFGGGGVGRRNRNSGPVTGGFRYPGPQPATLERRNMSAGAAEPGVPNLATMPGGYNVTDKADGLRCALFVAENGRIFLIDGGGRVYATGKQTDAANAKLVLDGEWIRRNRRGETVSHFYAFDILAGRGGDTAVTGLPFMIPDAMAGSAAAANTRQSVMAAAVMALGTAEQKLRGVPVSQDLQVGMKTFRTVRPGGDLFREAVAAILDDARSAPYNTDGLIFTPNAAPLPLGRGSWPEQLKWKPPHENTIDFLIVVDKERDKKGAPMGVDLVSTKYREDSGHTVRFKTLRLFVGSARDGAYADPRSTVMDPTAPLPRSVEEGEWRAVEFRPTEPRDPLASVCYVAIGEGAADPAGASAAATALDTDSTVIRTTRTGDILQDDMIVEMAYHPERAPGWRWEPVRVRHDKTERWLAGAKRGTMNADWVSNSIWSSLHNPITEDAVRTGKITECVAPEAVVAPTTYYNRRAPSRDLMKVQCLRNFHNDYVKRGILLKKTLRPNALLCDLAMGKAGDLHKWIAAGVGGVFGCDIAAANLNDPEDGAYRRLLDKMVALGGRDRVPPMMFLQADATRVLATGDAGVTLEDQSLLRREFGTGGIMAGGADVTSCMFALHYMFRDENAVAGFLTNLADTVKVGGYFVGCGFDGDTVARLLAGEGNTVVGRDNSTDVWMITKRYGARVGSVVPPSAAGLGLAVDVDFISIGETHTEFLVSWAYLQAQLATAGFELLTGAECTELGLPASSQMFSETWAAAQAAGETYAMSDAVQRFSFLNRWYVFKRRVDRRPAAPVAGAIAAPPVGLTEVRPERLTEAAPAAAILSAIPEGKEEETEVAAVAAPAPAMEVAPELDVIEMPPETTATGPFLVNFPKQREDPRLGEALSDWPRYMSLGILAEIPDRTDSTIKYPSVEAAVASAKFQIATGLPDKGPQLFRVEGTIHQTFERERDRMRAEGRTEDLIDKKIDDQVNATRVESSQNRIQKTYKSTWNNDAWLAAREGVYRDYIKRRYDTDARFRQMIQAIRGASGEILFANGKEANALGVGVLDDGTVVGGDNMIGKIMMSLE